MRKEILVRGCNLATICLLVIVLTFLLGSDCAHSKEVRGVTKDTIKIGVIMDQTGLAAPITVPITEATRTYFKNINDQGDINGRKVKIIVEDDRYTIPGAIAAFKKLIFRDEVLSILQTGGTGQTFALMRQIKKLKVPTISTSLAEGITTPTRRYIFTPAASYDDGLKIVVDYIMRDLKAKNPKIAFVYPDVEFGKNGLRATKKYLQKYNLKFSTTSIINLGEIDATSQVLTLKRSNPDYIILHDALAGLISFFKAANKYGLKSRVLGSHYVSDDDNVAATGDAIKDALAVSLFGFWYDNTPGMTQLREITKKYQPGIRKKTRSYTQGWVSSMICAEGLRRAGRNLNGETLVKAYETFKNFSTGDISGPVSYSENDHKGGRFYKFYKPDIERQTWTAITEDREPAFKD